MINNYDDNQVINSDFYGTHTNGTNVPEQRTGIIHAVKSFFKNYFNFSGCSTRSEFWWIQLIFIIYTLLIRMLHSISSSEAILIISILIRLGFFISQLSLSFRRLHDSDHSGVYTFLPLGVSLAVGALAAIVTFIIPLLSLLVIVIGIVVEFISVIALLVMYCQQTVPSEGNMYNNKSVNLDQYY